MMDTIFFIRLFNKVWQKHTFIPKMKIPRDLHFQVYINFSIHGRMGFGRCLHEHGRQANLIVMSSSLITMCEYRSYMRWMGIGSIDSTIIHSP
jgi:hypothetical protein